MIILTSNEQRNHRNPYSTYSDDSTFYLVIFYVMDEIRTTKIDGQEFMTLTDYLRLKEEKQELEYLWDINEEFKEENKKMKERIKELEATNKKRTADNWATFKS